MALGPIMVKYPIPMYTNAELRELIGGIDPGSDLIKRLISTYKRFRDLGPTTVTIKVYDRLAFLLIPLRNVPVHMDVYPDIAKWRLKIGK